MAVPAVLVGVEIPWWLSLCQPGLVYESDFRVFYAPAYMLRTHQRTQLYDFSSIRRAQAQQVANDNGAVPFLHPAVEAALFIPLTYLPYRAAYLMWVVVNCGVLTAAYFLLRGHLLSVRKLGPIWIIPGLLLGFMPVAFSVFAGQDSLLLLLVGVMAFRRTKMDEFSAGALLGLGAFRFQILLPLIVLFVLWRGFRFVCGCFLSMAAIFGFSIAISGIAAQKQYLTLLQQMGRFSEWLLVRRMPNLRGICSSVGLGTAAAVMVGIAVILLAFLAGRTRSIDQRLLLGISTTCIVTYYLFLHDLSIMLLPLLITIEQTVLCRRWKTLGAVTAVFSGYSVLWFLPNHYYLAVVLTACMFGLQITAIDRRVSSPALAEPVGLPAQFGSA